MKTCVFLDLDGTVLDFSASEYRAFLHTMQDFGIAANETLFARYHDINAALWAALERGEVTGEILRPLRFQRLLDSAVTLDWNAVNETYVSHLAQAGIPFPGALAFVKALHEQMRVVVLTNGIRHSQQSRLEKSGLAPFVDFMVTSEEAGAPKPAPKMFEMAMKRLDDWDKTHYIMIGDSPTADIAGAAQAGIESIFYTGGKPLTCPAATYTAKTYKEMIERLQKA